MLEGLDEINWSQLHHAYGEASNVPVLIRKLLSQDENERDEAEQDLFNCICHQGTIWEATSYTIPFLWELIKLPETPDKLHVIFLLASLAIGWHSYHGKAEDEKARQKWKDILAKNGKILEDEVAKGQEYDIIIGAGQKDLTPSPSPKRRGESVAQKQSPQDRKSVV